MDRHEAEQTMAAIAEVNARMNELADACEAIQDDEVKRNVKRAFARATISMWDGVMRPICRQFPDLDPDIGALLASD